jgi:hypothetical protein
LIGKRDSNKVADVEDGDESCAVLLQGRKEVALQRSGSEDDGSGLARLDEEWGGEGRCRGRCSAGVGARPWLSMMAAWNGRGGSGSLAATAQRRSVECASEAKEKATPFVQHTRQKTSWRLCARHELQVEEEC